MNQNKLRIGNFTSSEIYKLMSVGTRKMTQEELAEHKRLNPKSKKENIEDGFGKAALTYIEHKNLERKLGRSLYTDVSSRPTSWGKLVELQAFNLLGLSYKISSTETIQHPTINFWSGSQDCETFHNEKTVADIKCPITLLSFCQLADSKTTDELRNNHEDGEKFYWQLVSNAILTGSQFAELITYCPYKHELEAIRELADNYDGNQNKIAWINWAEDNDLPYLIKGNHYKNLNILRFEVPQADKDALTARVIEAGKMLNKLQKNIEPTEEELAKKIAEAHDKIKMMNELAARLKSKRTAA